MPKLTKQQWQIVIGGAVAAIALGFLYVKFFWLPISAKIEENLEKIAQIEAKIDKAKIQAARLPKLQEELALLNEQAQDAERRLPREKSVPNVLVKISALAEKHNVTLMSFTPGTQASRQFYNELYYPMQVVGNYHDLGKFFAGVSLEEQIFNIQNVGFGSPGERGIIITFILVSYQYKG